MSMNLLSTHNLDGFYGLFQALFSVNLEIDSGESIALIGANGAGKSTLLKALAGELKVAPWAIRLAGKAIGGTAAYDMARLGVSLVPEGRRLFPSLSVEENLLLGRQSGRGGPWSLGRLYDLFPVLKDLRHRAGTALSGGQQQLVALGRGLMANPSLMLCDEISLGLSPAAVKDVHAAIKVAQQEGIAIILVEQNIRRALAMTQRFYCLRKGEIALCGDSATADLERVSQAYFGVQDVCMG
jgi:branched-chain amino acid transport system ATP-binding protein